MPCNVWDGITYPFINFNGCNYVSMLGLKLIHVSKRGYKYPLPPVLHWGRGLDKNERRSNWPAQKYIYSYKIYGRYIKVFEMNIPTDLIANFGLKMRGVGNQSGYSFTVETWLKSTHMRSMYLVCIGACAYVWRYVYSLMIIGNNRSVSVVTGDGCAKSMSFMLVHKFQYSRPAITVLFFIPGY